MTTLDAHPQIAKRGRHRHRDTAIIEEYLAGQSLRTIGASHGLSHERIRMVLRREGIALRPRSVAKR